MPESATIEPRVPPIGFQMPRTGDRFAGIFTYSNILSGDPAYREYLEVKLDSTLIVGEYYCAEMYVSLAEGPKYASNNLGMYFHDWEINSDYWSGYGYANYGVALQDYSEVFIPQVNKTDVILDSTNWIRVSGEFMATSEFRYLTVGNLYNDRNTLIVDKTGKYPKSSSYLYAYYFIDDVSVERKRSKSFSFAGNTTICKGDTTIVEANGGLSDIVWSTLSDTLHILKKGPVVQLSPEVSTFYLVKGWNCQRLIKDTVLVTVHPTPDVNLGEDTVLCKGNSFLVDAGAGESYLWQDGTTTRFLRVSEAGKYYVNVKNQFSCYAADTIQVSLLDLPKVSLGRDSLLCGAEFYPLRAGGGQDAYRWSSGSEDSVFIPSSAGKYWVTVSNQCGHSTDSISIYSLDNIFIPNVLTPNQDGYNEKFLLKGIGPDVSGHLILYNRWGKKIFEARNYNGNWPLAGETVLSEIIYYTLVFPGCRQYKGTIHIIK